MTSTGGGGPVIRSPLHLPKRERVPFWGALAPHSGTPIEEETAPSGGVTESILPTGRGGSAPLERQDRCGPGVSARIPIPFGGEGGPLRCQGGRGSSGRLELRLRPPEPSRGRGVEVMSLCATISVAAAA